jgi:site-specific recombinase XerD
MPRRVETLDYYADQFLRVVAPDMVVTSTLMGYESAYNAHWRRFGHRRINNIKVSEYKRYLADTTLKRKTRRHILSVLRLIHDEAAADGVFATNPLANWKMRKDKEAEYYEADPYTADERDALLTWLKQNNLIAWRYFLHGFYSGMRTGELLGFPWKNYQPPHALIDQEMVRRKLHYYQKTGIRREVLVPRIVRDMLADNPTRNQGDLVHLTPTGLMFRDGDWLMKWWRRAHAATKVRRRTCPYPWRATFVSQCMSAGVNIEDVARWIGNSPQMIRAHYHKYLRNEAQEKRMLEQMEQAIR